MTAHLTQFLLNTPLNAGTAHDLVVRALDGHPSRAPFRLDEGGRLITIVSAVPLAHRHLGARLRDVRTKPYQPTPAAGSEYAYQIRVCPIRRTEGKGRMITADEEGPFIDHLLTRVGARALTAHFNFEGSQRVPQKGLSLPSGTFSGRLEVTDPAALQAALLEGVGRHRTYGYGLLQIMPA